MLQTDVINESCHYSMDSTPVADGDGVPAWGNSRG